MRGGNVNQTYIAKVAGTSQANISRWMGHKHWPRIDQTNKLCEAFGVSTSQLLGEEPIPRIDKVRLTTDEDIKFIEFYATMPDAVKEYIRKNAKEASSLVPSLKSE